MFIRIPIKSYTVHSSVCFQTIFTHVPFHDCAPPPRLTGNFSDLLSLVGTYDFRSYDSDPQKAKADLHTPTNPSFLSVESSTWELLFVESLVFSTNNL